MRNSESFPITTSFPSNMNKQRYGADNRQLFSKAKALTMQAILCIFKGAQNVIWSHLYTSSLQVVQNTVLQGEASKNGISFSCNPCCGFNTLTCLSPTICFNTTGLILPERRSDFPNVRSGFTFRPHCYRWLSLLLLLGIYRWVWNFQQNILEPE